MLCGDPGGRTLLTLAEFRGGKQQGFFGVPVQLGKVLREALHPAILHKGIGDPDIEGIVADRDRRTFDFRIAERIMPVIDMIDFDPLPRPHGRRPFARAGTGRHQKRVIIADMAVLPLPAQG